MPVLNREGGALNSPEEPLAEWAFRMRCLVDHDWRSAERNVYEPLALDQASRERHENLVGGGKLGVSERRRVNKGLAMELCAAGVANQLDRPAAVRAFCALNGEGRPKNVAQGGFPDVAADYGDFLVVIEASAKKRPSDDDYLDQLDAGLRHAERAARELGAQDKPCFCLIVNERSFGDQGARRVFRDFVRGPGRAPPEWPKLAPFSVEGFAELAHWAHDLPEGSIQADGVFAALSEIAALCLSDGPPEGGDWIPETAKARLAEATPQLAPRRRGGGGGIEPK